MISAAQIRAGRALINAKQSELAKAAGVALATLNNIERGVGDPRSSTLEAIERALGFAGVECESEGSRETVSLQRLSRPSAHDTYFACQRVLECLEPGSLLKVERVRFYVQSNSGHQQADHSRRIAVMVDGESRTLLFDQASFTLTDSVRVAEVARMLTSAMINCPGAVEFVDSVVEDTTVSHLEEAAYRLAGMTWLPLVHPKDLLMVYGDWTPDLERLADTREHPLHEAFAAAGGEEPSFSPQAPFEPPEMEDEPDQADDKTEWAVPDDTPAATDIVFEDPVEPSVPEPSEPEASPLVHKKLSAEEVAQLLGEPTETLKMSDVLDSEDEGPPLPDLSPPASDAVEEESEFMGDPPPLPDPSAPTSAPDEAYEEPEIAGDPPPLPDPSAPADDSDDDVIGFDDEDDPLLTTPPPSFKT